MPTANHSINFSTAGVSINKSVSRTGDNAKSWEITLPVGQAGTLDTRTDDNTGTAGLSGGHGIVTSDIVDVYWSGGKRYGMTATVSGNDVTVDGGSGDVLPVATTAVVVTKQVAINSQIDGDNIKIAALSLEYASPSSTAKGHVDMQDSGSSSIAALDLNANEPQVYDITGGATNPFTGNVIETSHASNGSSTEEGTLKILSLEDSTP